MKLTLAAIGKLKAGPERELAQRYAARIQATGGQTGIKSFSQIELPESRLETEELRKADEAKRLVAKLPVAAHLIIFDETAKSMTSRNFSRMIQTTLDSGTAEMAFAIGGPDGFDPSLRDNANLAVSFGSLTMPHQMVRVLVLEQIYRALTILNGHPYHRD